ncbi:MAG: P-II family nitrogen regulator [Pseudomonadota bacterium]
MTHFCSNDKVSVVTALLPRESSDEVIERIFNEGEPNVLLLNARGTLSKDRWYRRMLPLISPEKTLLQLFVPDPEVDHIVEEIIASGGLQRAGAGAVFSVPCDEFSYTSDFTLWSGDFADAPDATDSLKENLTAIFCIVQPEQTDVISRAAMQAGAHGPIVHYCEGRGLRDRLGWLKITKKPTKEVLVVVVDNADADTVVEAMVSAGRIDMPGRGFLYRMPVQKGLVSIASTVGARQATMQQVVAAIDSLKGSTAWREQGVFQSVGARSAGLNLFGKLRQRQHLGGQVILSCIMARKHAGHVMDAALAAGAPGANVSQARFIEATSERTSHGVRLTSERSIVHLILAPGQLARVRNAVIDCMASREMTGACVYAQPVSRAYTYIPGAAKVAS